MTMEDEMLKAVDENFPTPAQEYQHIKEILDGVPTISAYGTTLKCDKSFCGGYYADGLLVLNKRDCAALSDNEKVEIFIRRKWKEVENEIKTSDEFTFVYFVNEQKILEFETDNTKRPMNQSFNRLLEMRDIINKEK